MSEHSKDASMEEILSSIKRIIADDPALDAAASPSSPPKSFKKRPAVNAERSDRENVADVTEKDDTDENPEDAILELTETVETVAPERLIDDEKMLNMRQSLAALTAMEKIADEPHDHTKPETSLEDLTRDLLRPMLKQWIDDNLPTLVERLVAKEIQRISRK